MTMCGRADVEVRWQCLPAWLDLAGSQEREVWLDSGTASGADPGVRGWKLLSGAYFLLVYADQTTFVIDQAGEEVWVHWPSPLTLEDAATYLLGPVLGLLLQLRGVLTMHASAIAVGGYGLAVVGRSSAGKSTTAAALARRGFALLSDDIAALRREGTTFTIAPSHPQVGLWPDSTTALFGSPESLPRISPTHPTWDKRYLDVDGWGLAFCEKAIPLGAMYILEDRTEVSGAPHVQAVSNRGKLRRLVLNTFGKSLIDAQKDIRMFEELVRLAVSVHVRVVTPHANPDRLPQMCDAILADFASYGSSNQFWPAVPLGV